MANIYVAQSAEAAGSHHFIVCAGRLPPVERMTEVRAAAIEVMTSGYVDGAKPIRNAKCGVPWVILNEMLQVPFLKQLLQALEDVTLRLREESEKMPGYESYRGLARRAMVNMVKSCMSYKSLPDLAELGLSQVLLFVCCCCHDKLWLTC
jgi:hypothetical protein